MPTADNNGGSVQARAKQDRKDGMMVQAITEESGIHEEWYKVRPTLEELPKFLRHLAEDYGHDYGTICHALAAGAIATARALDDIPHGGITSFQAGAVMWEFIRHWMHLEQPLRLMDYEHMLYPQYAEKFDKTISVSTWEWLQKEARAKKEKEEDAHPDVKRHWESIVAGQVPFGYRVCKED